MGPNFLKFVFLISGVLLGCSLSLPAMAAHPASYCSLDSGEPSAQIEGVRANERLPIGSVSKLVTSYWALSVLKPTYKFATRIYISPVPGEDASTVDLHFGGSRDPYFGKENLHYLISELNKMKIYKVREMSFDQEFKFFWNVNGGVTMTPGRNKVETGYYGPDAPTAETVTTELKKYRHNLAFGYNLTRANLKKFNIELPATAKLSVQTIKYIPAEEFHAADNTIVRMIYSAPIVSLIKEMNRNSNNHAANQIFEHLGGAAKFKEFINADGFSDDDILFVNGHGNRKDIDTEESVYNEASCEAIVKIMTRLRTKLTAVNMDIDDVLAVPGLDQHSTLGAYENKPYADTMAAKTGTVGPAVTLAGMLQAKNGPVFFMYNMSTEGTRRDWSRARKAIATQLTLLTKKFNGGTPFDSHQVKFVAFDPELFFHDDDWKGEESPDQKLVAQAPLVVTPPKAEPLKQPSTATFKQIAPNFSVPKKASTAKPVVVAPVTTSVATATGQPLKTYKLAPPAPARKKAVASKASTKKTKSVASAKHKFPAKKSKTSSIIS